MNSPDATCIRHACGSCSLTCDLSKCSECRRQIPSGACRLCVECAKQRQECQFCRRPLQFDRDIIRGDLNELETELDRYRGMVGPDSVGQRELNDKITVIRQVRAEVETRDFDNVEAVIRRYQDFQRSLNDQAKTAATKEPSLDRATTSTSPSSKSRKSGGWLSWIRSVFD